jgi:hypothetical protein
LGLADVLGVALRAGDCPIRLHPSMPHFVLIKHEQQTVTPIKGKSHTPRFLRMRRAGGITYSASTILGEIWRWSDVN